MTGSAFQNEFYDDLSLLLGAATELDKRLSKANAQADFGLMGKCINLFNKKYPGLCIKADRSDEYRLRIFFRELPKVFALAKKINGLHEISTPVGTIDTGGEFEKPMENMHGTITLLYENGTVMIKVEGEAELCYDSKLLKDRHSPECALLQLAAADQANPGIDLQGPGRELCTSMQASASAKRDPGYF
ncbi:MAG: hypothetical protein ABH879_01400 [archaeon]